MQCLVPAKSGLSKESYNWRQDHGTKDSLMCVGSTGWPVWSDPVKELLWHKLLNGRKLS